MLNKIKRGVKKIIDKSIGVGKEIAKSLFNTKTRANSGIIIIDVGLGVIIIGASLTISAYLENGGELYVKEN